MQNTRGGILWKSAILDSEWNVIDLLGIIPYLPYCLALSNSFSIKKRTYCLRKMKEEETVVEGASECISVLFSECAVKQDGVYFN